MQNEGYRVLWRRQQNNKTMSTIKQINYIAMLFGTTEITERGKKLDFGPMRKDSVREFWSG